MRLHFHALPILLVTSVAAETTDFFGSLISDATSIYGQFTSYIGDSSTRDSSSASQTSSDGTNSASESSSTTSASTNSQASAPSSSNSAATFGGSVSSTASSAATSSAASATSPSSATSPTSTASSAAASAGSSSHGGGINGKTLGIILGCVLGVLLLLLLLLLFFCCRRRRHRRGRRSYLSKSERSSSSNEKGWMIGKRRRSRSPSLDGFRTTPSPWEHSSKVPESQVHEPKLANPHDQHNPFVPVPPPPRRKPVPTSTQQDAAHELPAQKVGDEFASAHSRGNQVQHEDNKHGAALAAGAGGLALGALAANHRSHEHQHVQSPVDHSGRRYSESDDKILPEAVSNSETRNDIPVNGRKKDGFDVVAVRRSTSNGSLKARRRSWSHSKENIVTPQDESKVVSPTSAAVVGAGAGVLAGDAVGRRRRRNSKSPFRKSILKQTHSDSSNPTSASNDYDDAVTSQASTTRSTTPGDVQGPTYDASGHEIPPAPPFKPRRQSPLGRGAPAAAAASYFNDGTSPPPKYKRYSIGSSKSPTPPVPPIPAHPPATEPRRHSLPSTRQRRNLALASHPPHDFRADSSDSSNQRQIYTPNPVSPALEPYEGYRGDALMSPVSPVTASQPGTLTQADIARLGAAQMPVSSSQATSYDARSFTSPSSAEESQYRHQPRPSSLPLETFPDFALDARPKGIVGDNGYPHLNIPRRMSGGEYDYSETGPLGPQTVRAQRPRSLPRTFGDSSNEISSGDDSAFRVGSGMPGAWGEPSPSSASFPRRSGDMSRYPPRAYNNTNASRSVRSRSSSRSSRYSQAASLPAPNHQPPPHRASRPGYGFGSGDPFDLATMRTDSNTTGYSMMAPPQLPGSFPGHYQGINHSRPTSVHSGRGLGMDMGSSGSERPEERYERLSRDMDGDVDAHHYNVGRAY